MKKIQITIPDPCHEDWDKMDPQEKGRFCHNCNKTVIDFSGMTDAQLAAFFRKPLSSVCGRLHPDQLDRDINIPQKRIPWLRYFFQFTLPAFLLSMKAGAQKGKVMVKHPVCAVTTKGDIAIMVTDNIKGPKSVIGRVVDEAGQGIAFASVIIKNTHTGTSCDKDGNFKIEALNYNVLSNGQQITLEVSAIGYLQQEIIVIEEHPVIVMKSNSGLMNPIEVKTVCTPFLSGIAGGISIVRRQKPAIPLIKRLIDTGSLRFSIYPNPSPAHSQVTIQLKSVKKGEYEISLVNSAGSIIQNSTAMVSEEKQALEFDLGNSSAGMYFIRLINKKSGKLYTQKIVIQ